MIKEVLLLIIFAITWASDPEYDTDRTLSDGITTFTLRADEDTYEKCFIHKFANTTCESIDSLGKSCKVKDPLEAGHGTIQKCLMLKVDDTRCFENYNEFTGFVPLDITQDQTVD